MKEKIAQPRRSETNYEDKIDDAEFPITAFSCAENL
jgi:hypothetical protein